VHGGVDLPADRVRELTAYLRDGLARFLSRPHLDPTALHRRLGRLEPIIPLALIETPRPAGAPSTAHSTERRCGVGIA
jgi:hypothetical protein